MCRHDQRTHCYTERRRRARTITTRSVACEDDGRVFHFWQFFEQKIFHSQLQTRQLRNMHVCCNTVRAVARVMQLMGKLKASKLLTDDVASSTRAGGDVLKYAVIIQVQVEGRVLV